MKHAGPVRRELGVPTAFNLLGPMTNPAGVRRQVIGVADPTVAAKVAHVLYHLGTERAFVVHGDGVDELPLDGSGVAYDVSTGGVRKRRINSVALGLVVASSSDLRGGDAAQNAAIIEDVLGGETGPGRDVVLLNAGAALLVAGRVPTLRHGVHLAAQTIDSGRARVLLSTLRQSRAAASAA
jgi:anthranilate phosphoribosyltransferase